MSYQKDEKIRSIHDSLKFLKRDLIAQIEQTRQQINSLADIQKEIAAQSQLLQEIDSTIKVDHSNSEQEPSQ